MKKLVIWLCILVSLKRYCQNEITFSIEDLSKPEKLLYEQSSKSIYERLIASDVDLWPKVLKDSIKLPYNIIAQSELPDSLVNYGYHSFFNGMYQAYADHRAFVLSPDMIWLLISQGFARHVNANSENLRHHFIDSSGKLSLIISSSKIAIRLNLRIISVSTFICLCNDRNGYGYYMLQKRCISLIFNDTSV